MKFVINGFQIGQSKSGKAFLRLDTSIGKMSCFDDKEFDEVKSAVNKEVEAEVEEKNGYKNLKFIEKILSVSPVNEAYPRSIIMAEAMEEKRKAEMLLIAKDVVLRAYETFEPKDMPAEKKIAILIGQIETVANDLIRRLKGGDVKEPNAQ